MEIAMVDCLESSKVESLVDHLAELTVGRKVYSKVDLMGRYSELLMESRWAGLKDIYSVGTKELAMADCLESSKVESLVDHLADSTVRRKAYSMVD
jgi:hypothetical protein